MPSIRERGTIKWAKTCKISLNFFKNYKNYFEQLTVFRVILLMIFKAFREPCETDTIGAR